MKQKLYMLYIKDIFSVNREDGAIFESDQCTMYYINYACPRGSLMGEYTCKQYRFIQKSLKWLIGIFVQTLVGSKLAVNKQINVINHLSVP